MRSISFSLFPMLTRVEACTTGKCTYLLRRVRGTSHLVPSHIQLLQGVRSMALQRTFLARQLKQARLARRLFTCRCLWGCLLSVVDALRDSESLGRRRFDLSPIP